MGGFVVDKLSVSIPSLITVVVTGFKNKHGVAQQTKLQHLNMEVYPSVTTQLVDNLNDNLPLKMAYCISYKWNVNYDEEGWAILYLYHDMSRDMILEF